MLSLGQPEARLAVEEAANPPAAQEAHRFKCLAGGVHRVEAVGRKLNRVDRGNARDQEDKSPGEVTLLRLVLAARLGIAPPAVGGANDVLASPKNTNRALAIVVDRHLVEGHAVPLAPVR